MAAAVVELSAWCEAWQAASRFKVAYGGRASGKSWNVARMILLRVAQRPMRVLCARELQVSIKDSVHRLLSDQIDAMGLADVFSVGESFIRSHAGGEFIFKGLRHHAAEIKSMEAVGLCWVEEAQGVSEDSWRLLTPTIRARESEIWVTFNPDLETDPTYKRFVSEPQPGTLSTRVNWSDNEWFPGELETERAWMERSDPDAYAHVWGGQCRTATDAQVLRGRYVVEPFEVGDAVGWDGPYYGADWGFSVDPTALVRLWIRGRQLHVEHEAWGVGVDLDDLPAMFDRVPRSREYVIRADSARPETISHMARKGFRIQAAQKGPGSVEDGIAHLRGFDQIVIHPRCTHAIEEARLWRYKTDRLTGDVLPDLIDKHNHIWDAARYALEPIMRARKVEMLGVRVPGL